MLFIRKHSSGLLEKDAKLRIVLYSRSMKKVSGRVLPEHVEIWSPREMASLSSLDRRQARTRCGLLKCEECRNASNNKLRQHNTLTEWLCGNHKHA